MAGFLARSRSITGPDGRVWRVRRVLLPRPPRWKGRPLPKHGKRERTKRSARNWADAADGLDVVGNIGEGLGGVAAVLVAIVFVVVLIAFAWFVLFPVLFLLLDLVLILLIAGGGVALRLLFRRPWKIEAKTEDPLESHSWGVVGLRASADAVHSVADALARGVPPGEIRPAR